MKNSKSHQPLSFKPYALLATLLGAIFFVTLGSVAQKLPEGKAPAKASTALDSETRLVIQSLSKRYQKLGNWQATFTQESANPALGRSTYNEGKLHFVLPNKFRYSLMRPESEDFISNGKEAWHIVYREGRSKPASVKHFKDVSKIELDRYLLLLKGIQALSPEKERKLLEDFSVNGSFKNGLLALTLSPKKNSEIESIRLEFKNQDEAPSRAIISDALGAAITIKIITHAPLKAGDLSIFKPDYPKGSKVEEL